MHKKDGVCESVPVLSGAVLKNNLIVAEALLKKGADPNCIRKREHAGKTTFHNALSDSLLIKNDKRMSELLIRNNADLNCTNMLEAEDGYLKHTLLNQAVATQDSEKLVMLLQLGADPNSLRIVKNGDGESFYTALNDSICRYKNLEIAKILLAYGADVSLKNRVHHNGTYEERTPLSYAISQNDLVFIKLLLQHGADPNVLRFEQNDAGVSDYFSPLGDCITQNMDSSIASLLLEHGADAARSEPYVYFKADGRVYQTSRVAIVPMLFLAAATANHIHGSDFRASEIIRLLVDYGASLNAVVDFRGVKCPIRKFPFTGIGVKGDTLMALQQVGWRGPGLFDRFTLSV